MSRNNALGRNSGKRAGNNSNSNSNSNSNANTKTNILKTRFNIMNKISDKFGFSLGDNNNNSNNSFLKKNKIYIIIAVVLLVIILIVSGVLIYRYLNTNKRVKTITKDIVPYIHDGFVEKTISYGSLPASSEGNEYNINMWLYVNDYENMQNVAKPIIYHGEAGEITYDDEPILHSGSNPSVWFRGGVNTLRVVVGLDTEYIKDCSSESKTITHKVKTAQSSISDTIELNSVEGLSVGMFVSLKDSIDENTKITNIDGGKTTITIDKQTKKVLVVGAKLTFTETKTDPATGCASKEDKKADFCDIKHFPLQRWVNVNISLTNNVIDIFLDGQLHKSCILSGAPTINKNPLHICKSAPDSDSEFGGFNGYISKLRYSNKALNMDSISKFYREGPVERGGGGFLDSLNFFK